MMGKDYAEQQIMDGELVLHCGHLQRKMHAIHANGEIMFTRPDGSTGIARWILQCEECVEDKLREFLIKGEGIWRGSDPELPFIAPEDIPLKFRKF